MQPHLVEHGGEGTPLVLVHGLGGSHADWHSFAPLLTAHGRVSAVDLIGHGLTQPNGRRSTIENNVLLLDRVLEDLDLPAILVGNSMGGMVSLFEAADRPERVAALVLIDPWVPMVRGIEPDPLVHQVFSAYHREGVGETLLAGRALLPPEQLVEMALALVCHDPSRIAPDLFAAQVELARTRSAMEWAIPSFLDAARSGLRHAASVDDYHQRAGRVRCPVLVLHGSEDRLVRRGWVEGLVALRPDWQLRTLEGRGHCPMMEAPEETASAVSGWLEQAGA
ncbi:MAG: alpha/beta fold hydrolase [Candidatus Dormibacteria bacterium]